VRGLGLDAVPPSRAASLDWQNAAEYCSMVASEHPKACARTRTSNCSTGPCQRRERNNASRSRDNCCVPPRCAIQRGDRSIEMIISGSASFHPKAWLFSFRSGPGSTVIGSSNLTQGGSERNLEANIFLKGGGAVRELENILRRVVRGRTSQVYRRVLARRLPCHLETAESNTVEARSHPEENEGSSDSQHRKHDGTNPDPRPCICVYRWHRRVAEGFETIPNDQAIRRDGG
jgi:hypothetical protein